MTKIDTDVSALSPGRGRRVGSLQAVPGAAAAARLWARASAQAHGALPGRSDQQREQAGGRDRPRFSDPRVVKVSRREGFGRFRQGST